MMKSMQAWQVPQYGVVAFPGSDRKAYRLMRGPEFIPGVTFIDDAGDIFSVSLNTPVRLIVEAEQLAAAFLRSDDVRQATVASNDAVQLPTVWKLHTDESPMTDEAVVAVTIMQDENAYTCHVCGRDLHWSNRQSKLVCPSCDEDDDLHDEW